MLEKIPHRYRKGLQIFVLGIAPFVTTACDELRKRINELAETTSAPEPPPQPSPEIRKPYTERAADAIKRTVACLTSTGAFETVPCDRLVIKFTDDIFGNFDAVEKARELKSINCMALSSQQKKVGSLRRYDGVRVKEAEFIFSKNPWTHDHGFAQFNFAYKGIRSTGRNKYAVNWRAQSRSVAEPEDLLRVTRATVVEFFKRGDVDLS